MPNAIDIIVERIPVLAVAKLHPDIEARADISDEQADRLRAALAAIPDETIEKATAASTRFSKALSAAIAEFFAEVGQERISEAFFLLKDVLVSEPEGEPN